MIKKISLIITACIILITAMSACGAGRQDTVPPTPDATPQSTPDTPGSASATPQEVRLQLSLSDVSTVDLDGGEMTGADITGEKLTVLNIWATWCGPCIRELPYLQEVSVEYADYGVKIVGVMQDGVTDWLEPDEKNIGIGKTLLEDAGAEYTVVLPDFTIVKELISTMQYFPTTFFLDEDGYVIKTVIGSKDADEWRKEIDEALSGI